MDSTPASKPRKRGGDGQPSQALGAGGRRLAPWQGKGSSRRAEVAVGPVLSCPPCLDVRGGGGGVLALPFWMFQGGAVLFVLPFLFGRGVQGSLDFPKSKAAAGLVRSPDARLYTVRVGQVGRGGERWVLPWSKWRSLWLVEALTLDILDINIC